MHVYAEARQMEIARAGTVIGPVYRANRESRKNYAHDLIAADFCGQLLALCEPTAASKFESRVGQTVFGRSTCICTSLCVYTL